MNVTVYSQPGCQPCRAVKRWLDRRGITYTAVDVTESADGLAHIKGLGYESVPVTTITERGTEPDLHWPGFDPNNLTKYTTKEAAA